jgi:ankyrin repeat protein
LDLASHERNSVRMTAGKARARFFLILEIATVVGAVALYVGVVRPSLKGVSQTAQRLNQTELNKRLMQTLKGCRGDVDADEVRKLLQQGASANATNTGEDSLTALMVASSKGYPGVVEALLDSGAEVNAKAKLPIKERGFVLEGVTALSVAALSGNAALTRMLISHGADIHGADTVSRSVMLWARSNEVVQVFLDEGLDINAHDVNGSTLLVLAAGQNRDWPDEAFLLQHGADPNIKDKWGTTALKMARGRPDVVELLTRAGARE